MKGTSSRQCQRLLRRMSSCPENLAYDTACAQCPEGGVSRPDSVSSGDSDKDEVDGPFTVTRRQLRSVKGQCPRHSSEMRLRRQHQSFEFDPNLRYHPLLRRNSMSSFDEECSASASSADSCDSPKFWEEFTRCFQSALSRDESTESEDPEPCRNSINITHQALTGRESFGCCIKSYRESNKKLRYYHVIVELDSYPKDSLASQLGLKENDEILMINEDAITLSDAEQVLQKFSHCLTSGELTLLIRRIQPEDGTYEIVEIKAEIEVTRGMIEVSTDVRLSFTPRGRYYYLKKNISGGQIWLRDSFISCDNGQLTVKKADKDTPYTFSIITLVAFDAQTKGHPYFYLFRENNTSNFIEVNGGRVELKDAGTKWTPDKGGNPCQPDSRFFTALQYGKFTTLHCTLNGKYLSCKNHQLELIETDKPLESRDYTAFEIK